MREQMPSACTERGERAVAGSIFTCSVSSKTTRKFAPRIDSVTTPSISSMSRSSAERFITGVSERGETEAADNCDVGVTPTTSAEHDEVSAKSSTASTFVMVMR